MSSSSLSQKNGDRLNLGDLKASIDMNCSICYEVFNDPLLLRCGHTFCKLCTERLIVSARETAQQRYHYGTPTMSCPECRAEMPADRSILVKNYRLADIINRFNLLETDSKEGAGNVLDKESPPPPRPQGILCHNCKEYNEPRHLFYCLWCSSGRSDPLFACGTCCVNHHSQHQLTSFNQMSTPEERQSFVNEAITQIHDASNSIQTNFSDTLRVPPEYQNLRNTLQDSFNHWEPVLNNLRTNLKLTKQEIDQHKENICGFLRLCQDTLTQIKKIEKKHINEIIALRESFSTKVINAFDTFSSPSNTSMISMPSTSSAGNEFAYLSPGPNRHRLSRRLAIARRRINANHPSTQVLPNPSSQPRYPGAESDDDL